MYEGHDQRSLGSFEDLKLFASISREDRAAQEAEAKLPAVPVGAIVRNLGREAAREQAVRGGARAKAGGAKALEEEVSSTEEMQRLGLSMSTIRTYLALQAE